MNTVYSFSLEITHADLPEAPSHQVRGFIVKPGFVVDGFVPALTYNDAAYSVTQDVPGVAVCVLQRVSATDHLGTSRDQLTSFMFVPHKN